MLRNTLAPLKARPFPFAQPFRTFHSSSPLLLKVRKPKRKSVTSATPGSPKRRTAKGTSAPKNRGISEEEEKKNTTVAFNLQQHYTDFGFAVEHLHRLLAGMRNRLRRLTGEELLKENEEKQQVSALLEHISSFLSEKLLLRIQLRTERATDMSSTFDELSLILFQINAMRVHDYISAQIVNTHLWGSDYDLLSFSHHFYQVEKYCKSLEEKAKQSYKSENSKAILQDTKEQLEKMKPNLEQLKQDRLECLNSVIEHQKQLIDIMEQLLEQKNSIVAEIKQEMIQIEAPSNAHKYALVSFDEYDPRGQFDVDIVETRAMLAHNLLAAGDYTDCVAQLDRVIEVPVDKANLRQVFRRAMSYVNRGSALMALKRLGEANDSLSKGLLMAQENKFQSLIDQVQRILPKLTALMEKQKMDNSKTRASSVESTFMTPPKPIAASSKTVAPSRPAAPSKPVTSPSKPMAPPPKPMASKPVASPSKLAAPSRPMAPSKPMAPSSRMVESARSPSSAERDNRTKKVPKRK